MRPCSLDCLLGRPVNPGQPQTPQQVIDFAGNHSLHVVCLHDGQQGLLRSPAGPQKAGKVGSLTQSGNLEGNLADPGLPYSLRMVIAVALALGATLIATSVDALLRFQLDSELSQELSALAQKVTVQVNPDLAKAEGP